MVLVEELHQMTFTAPDAKVIRTLRPAHVFYWLYGGILGGGVLIGILAFVLKGALIWQPAVILAVLLAGYLLGLAVTRLSFSSDLITYRTLFTKRNILISEVVRARLEKGFIAFSYQPYQRIVVTGNKSSSSTRIVINVGLFDRAELVQWIDSLNTQLEKERDRYNQTGQGQFVSRADDSSFDE